MPNLEGAQSVKPICVGLWLPFGPTTTWRGEGIARTIVFLLNGLATQGLVGSRVKIKIYTTPWMTEEIRESLQELLGPPADTIEYFEIPSVSRKLIKYEKFAKSVGSAVLFPIYLPLYVWRWLRPRKRKPVGLNRRNAKFWSLVRYHKRGGFQRPVAPGAAPAPAQITKKDSLVVKVIRRLPFVRRVLAYNGSMEEAGYALAAAKLKDDTGVDVWWAINPTIFGLEFLPKPVVVNFWDFASGEFGFLWPVDTVDTLQRRILAATSTATHLITQSRHNYTLKLAPCFGVERDRVSVVYLAHPDHYAKFIDTYDRSRVRSKQSRSEADQIIKTYLNKKLASLSSGHLAARGIDLAKLSEFDFATQPYVLISTQNRPYKNLIFAVRAFLKMVAEKSIDAKLILTAPFDLSDEDDELANLIRSHNAYDRVYSIPRVPEDVHAALYHCASATVHPSLTEGGVCAYPFLEGMVMGCPGLMGRADYTLEGAKLHPEANEVLFDVSDDRELIEKLATLLENSDEGYRAQKAIFEQHSRWSWKYASAEYLRVMLRAAGHDDAWLSELETCPERDAFVEHPAEWDYPLEETETAEHDAQPAMPAAAVGATGT